MKTEPERGQWCGSDPLYVAYHDQEWGVPVRDDRTQFEFLILEGAQAGLSWSSILKKREGYRGTSRTSIPKKSPDSPRNDWRKFFRIRVSCAIG